MAFQKRKNLMVCISVFLMIKMQSFYFWIYLMAYISNFGGKILIYIIRSYNLQTVINTHNSDCFRLHSFDRLGK